MSTKSTSDVHSPVSESGIEGSPPPAKIRKVEPDPQTMEEKSGSRADSASPAPSHPESSSKSKPVSSPCTCRCNGCCCHGTSTEPQHCVRCHTDYRLNHPEACAVPHVFTAPENYEWESEVHGDVPVPSICCGTNVIFGEARKGDWTDPFPCFIGWHTTDVSAIEESYNGVNILRCDMSRKGKCRRRPMKHSLHFELLYDEEMKYIKVDKGDHATYLKKKKDEIKDDELFKEIFHIEDEEDEDED